MLRWSEAFSLLQKTKPRGREPCGVLFWINAFGLCSVVVVFALVTNGTNDHGLAVNDFEQGHIA